MHYKRWRSNGDPLVTKKPHRNPASTLQEAFFAEVPKDVKTGECWEWGGKSLASGGYGAIYWGGESLRAHRVSYEIHFLPLEPGKVARHRCDNPPCVNPHHLEAGTVADNMDDAMERGRIQIGETCSWSKLTGAMVGDARARDESGESIASIARDLGVNYMTLYSSLRGKSWKQLEVAT